MTAVSKHVSGPLRQVQPHASETTVMHEAVVDLWRSAHVIAAPSCQRTSMVSYLLQTSVGLNGTQDLDQTQGLTAALKFHGCPRGGPKTVRGFAPDS